MQVLEWLRDQLLRRRHSAYACAGAFALTGYSLHLRVGVVDGHSMEPTMKHAAVYLIDGSHYANRPVRRGDVVVAERNGRTYLKRVAAIGGDSIYFLRHRAHQERQIVPEFQLPAARRMTGRDPRKWFELTEVRVPPGHCYLLGDNVTNSIDSRDFGPVPLEEIRGKVYPTPPAAPEPARPAGRFGS